MEDCVVGNASVAQGGGMGIGQEPCHLGLVGYGTRQMQWHPSTQLIDFFDGLWEQPVDLLDQR